ncbi:MAG: hypothetical protein KC474_10570, partial [Cyanobacteria bacterium HKST-UBA04]|nr:hypothetical protein [Cyanobacteria bacterium HKST-UBA04]
KLAKLVEQVKRNGTQETEGGQLYLQTDGSGKDARQLAGDVIDLLVAPKTNQKVATPANGILASIGFDTIMRAAPVTDTAAKANPVGTTKTALRRGFEHSAFETAPVLALYNRPKTDTATEQFIEDFDKSMKAAKAAVRLTSEQTDRAKDLKAHMAEVDKENYKKAFDLVALAIREARAGGKRASEVIVDKFPEKDAFIAQPDLYYKNPNNETDNAKINAAKNHNTSLYLAKYIIGILEKPAGKSGTTALLSHQQPRPEQTKAHDHYNTQLQAFIDGAKAKIDAAADSSAATLTALKFSD